MPNKAHVSSLHFLRRIPSVLVTGQGFPPLAVRACVYRLAEALDLPVLGLVDCNPFGEINEGFTNSPCVVMCAKRRKDLSTSSRFSEKPGQILPMGSSFRFYVVVAQTVTFLRPLRFDVDSCH